MSSGYERVLYCSILYTVLFQRVPGRILIHEVDRRAGGCRRRGTGSRVVLDAGPHLLPERWHHLRVEARPQVRLRETRVAHEPSGQVSLQYTTTRQDKTTLLCALRGTGIKSYLLRQCY